jgi:hypothetical protein
VLYNSEKRRWVTLSKRLLYSISYLYLAIPLIIFFAGWYKLYFGIFFVLALLAPLYLCFKDIGRIEFNKSDIYKISGSTLIVTVFLLLSGIGGIGFQNIDYSKHNAVLRDLIELQWPVIYQTDSPSMLVYYMAYYLPAAIVGKLTSFAVANAFQFIWSLIGMMILILLLFSLVKNFKTRYILIFVMFSGMDIIGRIALGGEFPNGIEHIEHWSKVISYQSNITFLFWVPQHAISGWLFTVFILKLIDDKNKYIPIILSLSIFWSPFIFLGLIPIVIYSVFKIGLKTVINLPNALISSIIVLAIGLYYMLNDNSAMVEFIWNKHNMYNVWPRILIFYLLEFGLYGVVLFQKFKKEDSALFYIAMGSLLLIPLIHLGMYGDFTMRASLPSLTVLVIYIFKYLSDNTTKYKTFLVMMLIIGSFTGLFEVSRSISSFGKDSDAWVSVERAENKKESIQYMAYNFKDSWYYKLFFRH